ncbi:MAG: endolytic transglycosylase MltG [bacterium]|nr:endolytic transglycosylase MltG [bacterium]
MKKRYIVIVTLIVLLITGYFVLGRIFLPPAGDFDENPIEVKIKPGLSSNAIANILEDKGIIKNADDFHFTCRLFRCIDRLKAGRYQILPGQSVYQVMKIIVEGKTSHIPVVIPEGFTSFEIASLLQKKLEIDSAKFIEKTINPTLLKDRGIDAPSAEGYLFPNTYYFYWGISEAEVIKLMVNHFFENFNDSLQLIVQEEGWTIHQIVTIASLIEGEAIIDSERVIISAIYYNRLKKGMLLQACPTVQYLIPGHPRRLLNRDLAIDSPYNTYIYPGLPPGPVNNPGMQSIYAAINPADVDYLYLVARGDGSHIFSTSLSQHLKAKAKFDELRRTIKRNQRLNGTKKR